MVEAADPRRWGGAGGVRGPGSMLRPPYPSGSRRPCAGVPSDSGPRPTMNRRETLRLLLLAAFGSDRLLHTPSHAAAQEGGFRSRWRAWPDLRWAGPEFWANRLQDWIVRDGRVVCRVRGANRTLHCLTHRVSRPDFRTSVVLDPGPLRGAGVPEDARVGFRLGIVGRFDDYRSAAVHGTGLDVALDRSGRLRVGESRSGKAVSLSGPLRLEAVARSAGDRVRLELTVYESDRTEALAHLHRELEPNALIGNVALVSHHPGGTSPEGPAGSFQDWRISGAGLETDPQRAFGPVMFAQYTLHRGTLKLTAQLAPLEEIPDLRVVLQTRSPGGGWQDRGSAPVDPLARTARFRVESWDGSREAEYRVRVTLPLRTGPEAFDYQGTIAAEPRGHVPVKAAVFSCNADHGFPLPRAVPGHPGRVHPRRPRRLSWQRLGRGREGGSHGPGVGRGGAGPGRLQDAGGVGERRAARPDEPPAGPLRSHARGAGDRGVLLPLGLRRVELRGAGGPEVQVGAGERASLPGPGRQRLDSEPGVRRPGVPGASGGHAPGSSWTTGPRIGAGGPI
jgi:hypothetical protein